MNKKRFAVSHKAGSKFARRGLRAYFEYRDLGIKRATRGKVVAHVIRARPGIRHRELSHSKDLELLEIVAPANFRTLSDPKDRVPSRMEKIAARKSRGRRSRG